MARFKAKRRLKKSVKFTFYIIVIILLFIVGYINIKNLKIINQNEFLNYVLDDIYKDQKKILDKTVDLLSNLDIRNPSTIISNSKKNNSDNLIMTFSLKKNIKKYDYDLYIYNTHQWEEYSDGVTVLEISKYLKQVFEKRGINVLLEQNDFKSYLSNKGLNINSAYTASRDFLNDRLSSNKIKIIFDIHRDGISKEASSVTIDGKDYAKIMFVVGTYTDNYDKNYEHAKKINDIITNKYPYISRGIYTREGTIYNQDIATNMYLIEIGGDKNSSKEVYNTIDLISDVITDYIGEYDE